MRGATYTYETFDHEGLHCLAIIDTDQGGKSLTNDIENVIPEICRREGKTPEQFTAIVYRDTLGFWDGYDWVKQDFITAMKACATDAINFIYRKPVPEQ